MRVRIYACVALAVAAGVILLLKLVFFRKWKWSSALGLIGVLLGVASLLYFSIYVDTADG